VDSEGVLPEKVIGVQQVERTRPSKTLTISLNKSFKRDSKRISPCSYGVIVWYVRCVIGAKTKGLTFRVVGWR